MKSAVRLAGALLLALFASTITANAQRGIVKTNIPFAFTVGDTPMPAGNYTITAWDNFVVLQTASSTVKVMSYSDDVRSGLGKLVFYQYGGQHFLHEVICANDASLLLPSKTEKQARRLAREEQLPNGGGPAIVTVR